MDTLKIRRAKIEDLKGILTVQNSVLLSKNKYVPKKVLEKTGFLVYPLTLKELQRLVQNKNCILLVALKNKIVIGYALAYNLKYWNTLNPNWIKDLIIQSQLKKEIITKMDKILYFRHIARLKDNPGVGGILEESVYTIAKKQGHKSVLSEILEEPIKNIISKKVHKKRGFEQTGHVRDNGKLLWGLYKKNL